MNKKIEEDNTNNTTEIESEQKGSTEDVEESIETSTEISELEQIKNNLQETTEKYLRCLAEIDNIRKRYEKSQADIAKFAIAEFAKDLISTLDIFNKALSSIDINQIEDSSSIKTFVTGIQLTQKELEKTLNKFGVIKISPLGEQFNPNLHETLYAKPNEEATDGTICEVMEDGYTISERLLRPAKVGIVKNS